MQPFLKHLGIVKVAKGDGRPGNAHCNNHKYPCKYYLEFTHFLTAKVHLAPINKG
jgi:hypothetical protein